MSDDERTKRLAEIEAREQAATAADWWVLYDEETESRHVVIGDQDDRVCECHDDECDPEFNAAFIAAARSDVPFLLAEVRRLEGQLSSVWALGAAGILEQEDDRDETIAALRAMLRRLEWVDQRRTACSVCDGYQRMGHRPDCELAALLKGGE